MIEKNWQELIKPQKLHVEPGTNARTQAVITAEPLERGFGLTLGNALRRVLLSSLQGGAVTSLQIDGVLHEFSSIPGVREDVTDIVLNIKQLALKHAWRRTEAPGAEGRRPGRSARQPNHDGWRSRNPEPGPRDLQFGSRRPRAHGTDRQHGQGLRRRRTQPSGRRADRPHPGRTRCSRR